MKKPLTGRRNFLQLAAALGIASSGWGRARAAEPVPPARTADRRLLIEFDGEMRTRLTHLSGIDGARKTLLAPWSAADSLTLASGTRIERFRLAEVASMRIEGPCGAGSRLTLRGVSDFGLEKHLEVELFERFPGFAIVRASYRNDSRAALALRAFSRAEYCVAPRAPAGAATEAPPFYSYCGSTHSDRRDWVQPVRVGFEQENFMGMESSDYGGGTPIVDVWRSDCGLAIGHLETTPRALSLPLRCTADGVQVSLQGALKQVLAPRESLSTPETFIATHAGDCFEVLDAYRRLMAARGIASPPPPPGAYEPIWCAWGYERDCTPQLIEDTLPKVADLGLRWAVIDDGWQSNVGDWQLNKAKYPRGNADMLKLTAAIRAHQLKARLWYAPLAVSPGSDLLRKHTDMLLLDKDGAVQNITWWNSFYLCPAYAPTVAYTLALVRKFLGEWKFAGLKIDGQHLNGVAPCFNPLHHHARPEESVEKLQDFFYALYRTALQVNPEAVLELCPCGTAYSFFNFRSFNQAPASDPESSWQIRHKGKALKALMGPNAAFAGDHVELSDGGDDFASTLGIGGIVSTKFTWPRDPKPKDSFLLTPAREATWRHWIGIYNDLRLAEGSYRGELYDIGFDKPETHVVEKAGRMYYAFYAAQFSGQVTLRGLKPKGHYRLRDYVAGRDLGEISAADPRLKIAFKRALLIEAAPA